MILTRFLAVMVFLILILAPVVSADDGVEGVVGDVVGESVGLVGGGVGAEDGVERAGNEVDGDGPSACVYYFYGIGCPHCANVKIFLSDLESKYPNVEIHKFEIYNNKENAELMNNLFDFHNYKGSRGVPVVFLEDKYFLGGKPITENLEKEILDNPNAECPIENGEQTIGLPSFVAIVGAALVDSINPCAIAVLLILLTSLFLVGKPKRAFKSGLAFTLSIFIMYFLIGIGLFTFFKGIASIWTGVAGVLRVFIGIFAIVIGLANIKDFFWYGKGFVMEIPLKWRPSMKRMLKRVTSPKGAFIVGFFVSAFELPCTGGPYFFVTGYLADKIAIASVIPILLFYNIVFILPLLILNFAFYFGLTNVEKTEGWRQRNIRTLHLIAGLIMVGLGIMVFLT